MRTARPAAAGSCLANHASLVTVNDATGTEPQASAHAPAPSRSTSSAASGADVVSFQSLAGRTGSPSPSSTTRPCCCAATDTAATSLRCGPHWLSASTRARHQARGSCSLQGGTAGGCGERPAATTEPVSTSRNSTLVDCVDESIPATSTVTDPGPGRGSARRHRHSSTTRRDPQRVPPRRPGGRGGHSSRTRRDTRQGHRRDRRRAVRPVSETNKSARRCTAPLGAATPQARGPSLDSRARVRLGARRTAASRTRATEHDRARRVPARARAGRRGMLRRAVL